MSDNYKEKLDLYKDGKLDSKEADLINEDLEKYIAIKEYVDENDSELFDKLKQEIGNEVPDENLIKRKVGRKISFRIVVVSILTILACLIIIPAFLFSIVSVAGSATRLDGNKFVQERNFTGQFLQLAFPAVKVTGGSDHTEFYKQSFTCNYLTGISRKSLSQKLEVNYKFGKLQMPKQSGEEPLDAFFSESFYALNPNTYFNSKEWNYLENAPEGTSARIFVTFRKKLTPEMAKKAIGEQYFNINNNFDIKMLADINSRITAGNVYYSLQNSDSVSKEEEQKCFELYNACDNDTHKQMLLYGLKQISRHKEMADFITENYSSIKGDYFNNIDEIISYVEKNGVQYVGALITGDSKELLKLKDNQDIYACQVEDIAVW